MTDSKPIPGIVQEAEQEAKWCEDHNHIEGSYALAGTAKVIRTLLSELQRVSAEKEQDKSDIDKFWQIVENGYDIEPRAYFEKEARTNGFDSPLAQAAHHMWKREPKVAELQDRLSAVEAKLLGKCDGCGKAWTADDKGNPVEDAFCGTCLSAVKAERDELKERDRVISHQLERRADGMDPLTQDLRTRLEASESRLVTLLQGVEGLEQEMLSAANVADPSRIGNGDSDDRIAAGVVREWSELLTALRSAAQEGK